MKETISIKRVRAPNYESCKIIPKWIIVMFNTIFFDTCIVHLNAKKNDCDYFCIDCVRSLCSNCLPAHVCHKYIKIRRYIYSDVINRRDLCKLFNCSGIQTYHTNKAKVVFLKQRQQQHQHHHQQNNLKEFKCIICHRTLQDNSSHYCSIACKVSAICGDDLKRIITYVNNSPNKEKDLELKYSSTSEDGQEHYPTLPFPKRKKLRRKGVPLRAPFF
ncbi:hypothetical protein UlMin_040636 [Ulmus minor]